MSVPFHQERIKLSWFHVTVTPLGIWSFRRTEWSQVTRRQFAVFSFFLSFFLSCFLLLIVSLLIQDADGKNDVSKKSHINLVKYPDNLNQKGESHNWFLL